MYSQKPKGLSEVQQGQSSSLDDGLSKNSKAGVDLTRNETKLIEEYEDQPSGAIQDNGLDWAVLIAL